MTRSRSLPKCLQLSEMLIREIAAGHIPNGSRLPPERAMAAEHKVAVGTLRKALATLEEKGLLERIQGSGNYVRANGPVESVYSFFRLELVAGGGLPTAIVVDVSSQQRPHNVPELGPKDRIHRIRRLRYLDDTPIALEEIWLDGRFAPTLEEGRLVDSLYLFYKENLGLIITHVEDRIGVGTLPAWQGVDLASVDMGPETFRPMAGDPTGYIERISYDQHDRPAEYSRTWFDAEKARYINRL